jgi:SlyX protein
MSQPNETKQFEDQLIELQSQLAFQEDTIQALNDVVAQQQQQIDSLRARSDLFSSQLERAMTAMEGSDVIDVPPPHY